MKRTNEMNIIDQQANAAQSTHADDVGSQQDYKPQATRSVYSYKSGASAASHASFKSRVVDEKKRQADTKSQWNESVTSSKREMTTEDQIARKIAAEILANNSKLRGVHSGASIKKILEKEAKK